MLVRLARSGGLAAVPGLNRPVELDTARLSEAEAAELADLVRRSGLAAAPQQALPLTEPPHPDAYTYTLVLQDEGGVHRVQLQDPVDDPVYAALLDLLASHRTEGTDQS